MIQRHRSRVTRAIALTLAMVPALWGPLSAQASPDPDIVFATASKGMAYWGIGQRLKKVAARAGLRVDVVATAGSTENLRRLSDPKDPVNLILTQSDALRYELIEHPKLGRIAEIMESIGLECVFAITAADGKVTTEKGWQNAKSPRVAVPGVESGAAVTLRLMEKLVPELADDVPVYMDLSKAMQALHAKGKSRIDVVLQVYRPKFETEETRDAIEHPDQYHLLSLTDQRLQAELPNGEDVYLFLDVPLVSGGGSLPTMCTKGLLVSAPDKISPKARAKLQHIVETEWMKIYPEESD